MLRHAWKQLRPGGRIVILDGKLPAGLGGKLVLPFSLWLMKRTMLGNPFIKPWNDLAALADDFDDGGVPVRLLATSAAVNAKIARSRLVERALRRR